MDFELIDPSKPEAIMGLTDLQSAHFFKPVRPCDDCGKPFATAPLYWMHLDTCAEFLRKPVADVSDVEIATTRAWLNDVMAGLNKPNLPDTFRRTAA
ncbi:hypothetical protein ACTWJ8_30735 [Streptomyces sp. SDT5-1]|uniref:hypothetical protein n=1 Tax=Streptomyces sp. SDT5-1 TaxID=3406418 RepID=UPI003FD55C3E